MVAGGAADLNLTVLVSVILVLLLGSDIDIHCRAGCRRAVHLLDRRNDSGHDVRLHDRNRHLLGVGHAGSVGHRQSHLIGTDFRICVCEDRVLDGLLLSGRFVTERDMDIDDVICILGAGCIIAVRCTEHLCRGINEVCLRNSLDLDRIQRHGNHVAVIHDCHDAVDHIAARRQIGICHGISGLTLHRLGRCKAGFRTGRADLAVHIETGNTGHIRTGPVEHNLIVLSLDGCVLDLCLEVVDCEGIFLHFLIACLIGSSNLNRNGIVRQNGRRKLTAHDQLSAGGVLSVIRGFNRGPFIGFLAAACCGDALDTVVIRCQNLERTACLTDEGLVECQNALFDHRLLGIRYALDKTGLRNRAAVARTVNSRDAVVVCTVRNDVAVRELRTVQNRVNHAVLCILGTDCALNAVADGILRGRRQPADHIGAELRHASDLARRLRCSVIDGHGDHR